MTVRLVVPSPIWDQFNAHVEAARPEEDGAFLLFDTGRGADDTRLLVNRLLLPTSSSWESRGNHNLRPSGQWLSAAIGEAIETDSGLAFAHSHPDARHPPELSWIDEATSREWARMIVPTIANPFASLVWSPQGITGWAFTAADNPEPISIAESTGGRTWRNIAPAPRLNRTQLDDRQVRALGAVSNARLRRLVVAVVGVGGTGAPVAETLARMGVARLIVIDPDTLDEPSNLRRVTGATARDAAEATPKVAIARRHVEGLGIGVEVCAVHADVRSRAVVDHLIGADLIVNTTDTHSSRAFVNQVALQYAIPVVDVGVRVGTSRLGAITGMPVEVRVLLPDAPCLWCMGVLDSKRIRAENLPPAERAALAGEGYVQGVDEPQPSLAALNLTAAALAATTVLQLTTGEELAGLHYVADVWNQYVQPMSSTVDPSCLCQKWRGRGDRAELAMTD